MKVRLKASRSGLTFAQSVGDEIEVTADEGTRLIAAGIAEIASYNTATICFIGTSLINQAANASSDRITYTTKSWMTWAQVLSGWRFESPIWYNDTVIEGWEPNGVADTSRNFWGFNAGVSGQTAQQIYDRREKILEINAEYYVLDMGTNDMGILTADAIIALRESMVDYLLSKGKKVIILPILARNTSSWGASSDERKKYNYINRRTMDMAEKQNTWVFDWNRDWIDYDSANGNPISGNDIDGIHFNAQGAYAVGKHFKEFITALIPERPTPYMSPDDNYDATHNPYGNSMSNPLLAGTSGANTSTTGEVADDMRFEKSSGAGTGVASKISDTKYGDTQRLVMTCQGSAGNSLYYFRTSSSNVNHSYAGKWVEAFCLLDVDNSSGQMSSIKLVYDDNLNGISSECLYHTGDNFPTMNETDMVLKTPPMLLAAGSVSGRWRLEIEIDDDDGGAGTATCTVDIKYIDLREVESPIERYGISNPS